MHVCGCVHVYRFASVSAHTVMSKEFTGVSLFVESFISLCVFCVYMGLHLYLTFFACFLYSFVNVKVCEYVRISSYSAAFHTCREGKYTIYLIIHATPLWDGSNYNQILAYHLAIVSLA